MRNIKISRNKKNSAEKNQPRCLKDLIPASHTLLESPFQSHFGSDDQIQESLLAKYYELFYLSNVYIKNDNRLYDLIAKMGDEKAFFDAREDYKKEVQRSLKFDIRNLYQPNKEAMEQNINMKNYKQKLEARENFFNEENQMMVWFMGKLGHRKKKVYKFKMNPKLQELFLGKSYQYKKLKEEMLKKENSSKDENETNTLKFQRKNSRKLTNMPPSSMAKLKKKTFNDINFRALKRNSYSVDNHFNFNIANSSTNLIFNNIFKNENNNLIFDKSSSKVIIDDENKFSDKDDNIENVNKLNLNENKTIEVKKPSAFKKSYSVAYIEPKMEKIKPIVDVKNFNNYDQKEIYNEPISKINLKQKEKIFKKYKKPIDSIITKILDEDKRKKKKRINISTKNPMYIREKKLDKLFSKKILSKTMSQTYISEKNRINKQMKRKQSIIIDKYDGKGEFFLPKVNQKIFGEKGCDDLIDKIRYDLQNETEKQLNIMFAKGKMDGKEIMHHLRDKYKLERLKGILEDYKRKNQV